MRITGDDFTERINEYQAYTNAITKGASQTSRHPQFLSGKIVLACAYSVARYEWMVNSTYYLLVVATVWRRFKQESNNVINFCGKYNFVTIGDKNISNKEYLKCKNRQNKLKQKIKRKGNLSALCFPLHGESRKHPQLGFFVHTARSCPLPSESVRAKYLLCKTKVKWENSKCFIFPALIRSLSVSVWPLLSVGNLLLLLGVLTRIHKPFTRCMYMACADGGAYPWLQYNNRHRHRIITIIINITIIRQNR